MFVRLSIFPPAFLAGGISLSSFLVAPTILGSFDTEIAGPVMRSLFPVYYPALGGIALAGIILYGLSGAKRSINVMAAILAGSMFQYFFILDHMESLRVIFDNAALPTDQKTTARSDWGRWHGISMIVNMAQLLLSLVLVWTGSRKQS